jgi:DNA-binding GntR family transcriptional regulator
MRGEAPEQSALRTEHLAARFGVSATPVREALMSLSGEGLVEFRPGRGFRVVPMSRQDLIDIYDAQAYFAGELAGRAALHLTDENIEQLSVMQQAIVDAIDRGDAEAERAEWELHAFINRIARADKLSWLLRSTVRYAPFRAWSSVTGWAEAAPEGISRCCVGSATAARARPATRWPPTSATSASFSPTTSPSGES